MWERIRGQIDEVIDELDGRISILALWLIGRQAEL